MKVQNEKLILVHETVHTTKHLSKNPKICSIALMVKELLIASPLVKISENKVFRY